MNANAKAWNALDLGALVTRTVPSIWMAEAVPLVRNLSTSGFSNAERREYAVGVLMRTLHTEEFRARLLLELAVLFLKTTPTEQAHG